MGKVFARIDDRLIHGQIVAAWCLTLGIQQIVAVDDELAANPMLQSIMTMGVPAQYHPQIVSAARAKELLQEGYAGNRLLITRYAHLLAPLEDELKGCEHINIGNSSKLPDSVYKIARGGGWYIYLSEADWALLNRLASAGVSIISQQLPSEKMLDWETIKKKIEK